MYCPARVEYLVLSSQASFSALQLSQPAMQWEAAWFLLPAARCGSSAGREGGGAAHAQSDACFMHKVVQQMRTRSKVFQYCPAMRKIIQLSDKKYDLGVLKCVPSRWKHVIMESHYPCCRRAVSWCFSNLKTKCEVPVSSSQLYLSHLGSAQAIW